MTVNDLLLNENFIAITLADGEREISDVYIGDLLSWVMGRAKPDDAWITIMSNVNILAVASLVDTACIILAEGVMIDEEIKNTAIQKNINVISTELSAFEAAVSINELL